MTDQPSVQDKEAEKQAKREKFVQDIVAQIHWNPDGFIPAVTQDIETGLVLQIGWLNAEALRSTLLNRVVHYWSAGQDAVIQAGADEDAQQRVAGIYVDHAATSILLKVMLNGPACENGSDTCFDRPLDELLDE